MFETKWTCLKIEYAICSGAVMFQVLVRNIKLRTLDFWGRVLKPLSKPEGFLTPTDVYQSPQETLLQLTGEPGDIL